MVPLYEWILHNMLPQTMRSTEDSVTIVTYLCITRYHKWMEDTNLRQLTASEPLSLDEEYNMQQSWLNDENSECHRMNAIYLVPSNLHSHRTER